MKVVFFASVSFSASIWSRNDSGSFGVPGVAQVVAFAFGHLDQLVQVFALLRELVQLLDGVLDRRALLQHLLRGVRVVPDAFGLGFVVQAIELAAQTVPILGAVAGAGVNWAFTSYYQEMAHIYFGLKRLAIDGDYDHATLVEEFRNRLGAPRVSA